MIAIVPARGGSVRVPRKNIAMFKGLPMIQWPIQALQDVADEIVVSTDDIEIAEIARKLGCQVHKRAKDDGSRGTQEIAKSVLQWASATIGTSVVVYPCSPMLTADDLRAAMRAWSGSEKPYAVSYLPDGTDAGCFYFGWTQAFRRAIPLNPETVMPVAVPADRFIDINTPEDWSRAEAMFDNLMEKT